MHSTLISHALSPPFRFSSIGPRTAPSTLAHAISTVHARFSKPASPSDFVWYHSDGDDESMDPVHPGRRERAMVGMISVAFSVTFDLLTIGHLLLYYPERCCANHPPRSHSQNTQAHCTMWARLYILTSPSPAQPGTSLWSALPRLRGFVWFSFSFSSSVTPQPRLVLQIARPRCLC
jgi:hypothetical protein